MALWYEVLYCLGRQGGRINIHAVPKPEDTGEINFCVRHGESRNIYSGVYIYIYICGLWGSNPRTKNPGFVNDAIC